eukprot:UN10912
MAYVLLYECKSPLPHAYTTLSSVFATKPVGVDTMYSTSCSFLESHLPPLCSSPQVRTLPSRFFAANAP